MIERRAYLATLFDLYEPMLTEKQQLVFDLYHQCDLSLGEIAEESSISRQAVFDIIKRTEKTLEEYEEKLQLAKKEEKRKKIADHILYKIEQDDFEINEIKALLVQVISE